MNSPGSRISCCHSTSWRSQAMRWSSVGRPLRPSLYFQCAAMPSSAMRCISSVRICTSKAWPPGPITEVCSDWYRLGRGMAMKSLMRPGNGAPLVVDHAQRGVAVLDRVGDDAQRPAGRRPGRCRSSAASSSGRSSKPLDAALDAGGNALPAELLLDRPADLLEELLDGAAAWTRWPRSDLGGGLGLQVAEGQVLQLAADSCPCPGGARWARRSRGSPARCAAGVSRRRLPSVRMLCRRSASLTMTTRMSSTMASSILRKLSAWRSSRS